MCAQWALRSARAVGFFNQESIPFRCCGPWARGNITTAKWQNAFSLPRRDNLVTEPASAPLNRTKETSAWHLCFFVFALVVSKGCKPRYHSRFKKYGKFQQLRALCFSLSRYRLNRLSLLCDSASFHMHQTHQLHMVQGESMNTPGLGPLAPAPR